MLQLREDEIMICGCKVGPDGIGCGEGCLNRLACLECVARYCPCGDRCTNQRCASTPSLLLPLPLLCLPFGRAACRTPRPITRPPAPKRCADEAAAVLTSQRPSAGRSA